MDKLRSLFRPPTSTVEVGLGGEPLKLVTDLGGPLGDIAHDDAALSRATDLANGPRAATFSYLMLRHRACFGWQWTKYWAIVSDGLLKLYADAAAAAPNRTFDVKACACSVSERENARLVGCLFSVDPSAIVNAACLSVEA